MIDYKILNTEPLIIGKEYLVPCFYKEKNEKGYNYIGYSKVENIIKYTHLIPYVDDIKKNKQLETFYRIDNRFNTPDKKYKISHSFILKLCLFEEIMNIEGYKKGAFKLIHY